MSKTVDERVVEMQFDNSKFESNVKTSMNTIDKLKDSLNFSGVGKSFDEITSSAEKVDVSSIGSAVEKVQEKFSYLEVVAVAALAKITTQAVEAGEQLIKSLSVDQISAGWEKFAENTKNIGTLVSQGFELDEVEDQMARLLWYTDETSYNYTEMVNTIGKFTASGQGLTESVTAMEGIANWAALSGQNASTASRAMYQLAQAMSAGVMKLQDWKSIQTANMDTAEFRQKCLDAGVACGTLTQNIDGTYESLINNQGAFDAANGFTEHLTQDAWLTSEVMMAVYEDYANAVDQIYDYAEANGITASEAIELLGDDLDEFGVKAFKAAQEARTWGDVIDSVKDAVSTGWMTTFTYIFGNYEEATELWTDLSNAMYDVFMTGINDRNDVLEAWSDLGGRTVLIEAFWTAWENVGEILGTIKQAFKEVFPSKTADQLYSMTETLKSFTERLKMSDENLQNLKSTFKGLFSILDIVKQAFSALVKGVSSLVSGVGTLASGILGVTGSFGDWITRLDETIKESDIFNVVVQKLVEIIQNAVQAIVGFGKAILEWLNFPDLSTITASVKSFINAIKENFAVPGFEIFKSILSSIKTTVSNIASSIVSLKDTVSDSFDEMGNSVSDSLFVRILSLIWSAIKSIASAIKGVLTSAVNGLSSALKNFDLTNFFSVLNDFITSGLLIAVTELIHNLGNSVGEASKFFEKLGGGITSVLSEFGNVLKSWSKDIQANTILKIAAAIGVLAIALIALSSIDSDKMAASVAVITGLMVDLIAAMTAFYKLSGNVGTGLTASIENFINSFTQSKQASSMIKMAAAIGILAVALGVLAKVDQDNLGSALVAITGLFADLVASMAVLEKLNGKVSGLTAMIGIAAAIAILSSALKSLSGLDWDEIAKGLTAVTGLCVDLVASMVALGKLGGTTKGAVAMIALAAAVKILASACESFAGNSWEEITKGLTGVGGILVELAAFSAIAGGSSKLISIGLGMIELGAAIEIFANAMKKFAVFSWEEIAKGLVAMGGALAEVTVALNLMPKNMVSIGTGLIEVGAALEIVANVMSKMGGMSWDEIAKGLVALGGALAELAIGLNLMNGTLSGSSALLVAAAAIDILTPALKSLGKLSIEQIAAALVTLAGSFTIIGVAAAVLSPLTTTILELSAAFALIGVSVAAVGVGLVAAGAGITSIAAGITALLASVSVSSAAVVSSIEDIALSVISFIPNVLIAIGEGIVGICDVIAEGASSIGNAVKEIILALVDVFVECIPALTSGLAEMILGLLDSLNEFVPQIVEALVQMIIGIINALANNIPDFLAAVMNLVGELFESIIDALGGLDTKTLVEGIACVGLLAALVAALSAVSAMVPSAMAALAEIGALVAEMAVIFAAIGGLAQIPGLTWLIDEGANLLEGIGNAIGSFIGGIIGGIMGGITSQLPQIGTDLSEFMTNVQPFIDGASKIDASMLNGVKDLADVVIVLTKADIISGLTSWFTGGSSLADFGAELADFGPYFASYYQSVQNVDGSVVEASANAASALAKMADNLPKQGGVVNWFTGENTLSAFGEELSEFGPYLAEYGESVADINADVVEKSANAALVLFQMAENLPNQGGLVSWFTGDNTLSAFGEELSEFGPYLAEYSESVADVDADVVQNSANAATALAEMSENLPNQGGLISWFTGDNTLSAFGAELAAFGPYLAEYSESIENVTNDVVEDSANAATALAKMAENLPNQGGIVSWFTGDNTLSVFGKELSKFGPYLAKYSESVEGVESDTVEASANAGSALAKMADNLPNQGGIVSWFTGDNTLSAFGKELAKFGPKLKEYADSVDGLQNDVVEDSANAALALFEMAENLPNQGGFISWFKGETTLSEFADELSNFGPKLKNYADSVDGLNADAVEESANAGKILFEMAENLPNQGGFVSWFTGDNTLSAFAEELAAFGPKLKEYAEKVDGLSSDAVEESANAALILFEMAENLPNQGGVVGWFTGDNTLSAFGAELADFGPYLAFYASRVKDIDGSVVENSANAAKALAELANNLPNQGGLAGWFSGDSDLGTFGEQLATFGASFSEYYKSVKDIKTDTLAAVSKEFKTLVDLANGIFSVDAHGLSDFAKSLTDLGNFGVDGFVDAFKNSGSKVSAAVSSLIESFTTAINGKKSTVLNGFSDLVEAGLSVLKKQYSSFQTEGSTLITKIITGIKSQDSNLKSAITSVVSTGLTAIKDKYSNFQSTGSTLISKVVSGIKSQDSSIKSSISTITSSCIKAFKDKYSDFQMTGSALIDKVISGIKSEKSSLISEFSSCLDKAVKSVKDYYKDFYSAGSYLVEGFASGITDNTYKATAKSQAMARAAAQAAANELDEHSPSKVGYQIGDYFGVAFVDAIEDYTNEAYSAASDMAGSAEEGLTKAVSSIANVVNGDLDLEPTIRPVLDLSDVEEGSNKISALFSRTQAQSISASIDSNSDLDEKIQNGEVSGSAGNSYQFTQNNYSPKALSRTEIYRQTKNQFSALERMMEV